MEFVRPYVERITTQDQRRKASELYNAALSVFTQHPQETGESYLQHLAFTLKMGARIVTCGALLLIHGFFPFTFRRTVSTQIKKIYAILNDRGSMKSSQITDSNWEI